jgi:hypothetical protein
MSLGENCRSGCLEKNHESWIECLRDANLNINAGDAGRVEAPMTAKKWDAELSAYRDARAQGIQPAGTTLKAVNEAKAASDKLGAAYNADVMPSADKITKQSASVLKHTGDI